MYMEWYSSEEEDQLQDMENTKSEVMKPEIPNQETRNIQAMLFTQLVGRCLKVDTLEKHKQYLDIPIVYDTCKEHEIDIGLLCDKEADKKQLEDRATYIRNGTCSCEEPATRKEVSDIYFVHLASGVEDFLPVLMYLSTCCDLNRHGETRLRPLMTAVVFRNLEAVKFLLSKDVDVNIDYVPGDQKPLWYTIIQNMDEYVPLLLAKAEIDLNIKSARGYPLLHFCYRNHSQYFDKLLETGADPDITDTHMTTALMIAVSHNSTDAVQTLIRHGANVNQKSRRNDVPLIIAVYSGNEEIVEVLLDAGADPNFIASPDAETPVLHACFDGDIEILKLLIKYKADVRKANHQGYTPLHIAAWNGHTDCVKEIVKAGALHDIQTSDLNTPLALAAHGRHLSVIKELLPLGCNVNSADKDLDTPIIYAAFNGMTHTIELLLKYGADPNGCNRIGATPLWNAVYNGHKETVKLLLKENVLMETKSVGIDQHHQSDSVRYLFEEPKSPLWVAVQKNQTDIALLLVTAGYSIYNELWLLESNFPQESNQKQLQQILVQKCQTPPKLIVSCRNCIRYRLGLGIKQKVAQLEIPTALKNYLAMAELKYTIDESSEDDKQQELFAEQDGFAIADDDDDDDDD